MVGGELRKVHCTVEGGIAAVHFHRGWHSVDRGELQQNWQREPRCTAFCLEWSPQWGVLTYSETFLEIWKGIHNEGTSSLSLIVTMSLRLILGISWFQVQQKLVSECFYIIAPSINQINEGLNWLDFNLFISLTLCFNCIKAKWLSFLKLSLVKVT